MIEDVAEEVGEGEEEGVEQQLPADVRLVASSLVSLTIGVFLCFLEEQGVQ